jgi:hypothetical protein
LDSISALWSVCSQYYDSLVVVIPVTHQRTKHHFSITDGSIFESFERIIIIIGYDDYYRDGIQRRR